MGGTDRLGVLIHAIDRIAKIMALTEVYGSDKVARAIEDAFDFAAFSSGHIANGYLLRELGH